MTSKRVQALLIFSLTILMVLAGCAADNNQGTAPNQNGIDQSEMPGSDSGAGMKGGANEGFDAQDFRPLYRRGDGDAGWRRDRFSSFNDRRTNNRNDLDSRRMQPESRALSSPLGFADYTANSSEASYRGFGSQTYSIDRQLLAELIGQVVVGLPDVEKASVLVTDQYCLVGYSAQQSEQAKRHVDQQVTMAANSVVPGWYKVYTTADSHLTDHIRQIAQQFNGTSDVKNLSREVEALVEQLGGPDRSNDNVGTTRTDRPEQNFNRSSKTDNFHRQGNINQQ